jgi:hypothetical protein
MELVCRASAANNFVLAGACRMAGHGDQNRVRHLTARMNTCLRCQKSFDIICNTLGMLWWQNPQVVRKKSPAEAGLVES